MTIRPREDKSTLLDLTERNTNHISRRTAICRSVAEVKLTGVSPLGAINQRFNFLNLIKNYLRTYDDFACAMHNRKHVIPERFLVIYLYIL